MILSRARNFSVLRFANKYNASRAHYRSGLTRLVHEWPFGDLKLAYLAPANDDNLWIELLAGGNPAPAGYHHFCIDVKSVDETLAELRGRDVTIVGEPFDLPVIGKRLAFFSDPDGNLIEIAEVLN